MFTIYKAIIRYANEPQITGETVPFVLPAGAVVLKVGAQNDNVCVWYHFESDPHATGPGEKVSFLIVGTGMDAPGLDEDYMYLDSVVVHNGDFVWHIFQRI